MRMNKRRLIGRILNLNEQLATGDVVECVCGVAFGGPEALDNLLLHQNAELTWNQYSIATRGRN